MIISVINMTNGAVSDADLQRAIRAVNRQIGGDFAPYWSFGAQLRLEGRAGKAKRAVDPSDMRGDAILYLRDVVRIRDAEGYHDRHFSGIPYGIVFLELSKKLKEDWTVTLSHEALELTGDPENNLLVQGPHPKKPRAQVFHWFEMCDAVQEETYRDRSCQREQLRPSAVLHEQRRARRAQRLPRHAHQGQDASFVFGQPRRLHRFLRSRPATATSRGRPTTIPEGRRGWRSRPRPSAAAVSAAGGAYDPAVTCAESRSVTVRRAVDPDAP